VAAINRNTSSPATRPTMINRSVQGITVPDVGHRHALIATDRMSMTASRWAWTTPCSCSSTMPPWCSFW